MGTAAYGSFLRGDDDYLVAFNVNGDGHPESFGEDMAAVARRRVSHPDEPLFTSMVEGLSDLWDANSMDPGSLDHSHFGTVGARNRLFDCVYTQFAYFVNLDDGTFEAWGWDSTWYSTDTPAAREHPDTAARYPRRPLLGVYPLDVPEGWAEDANAANRDAKL